MDEQLQIRAQAEKIRSQNVLGRTGTLPRLFDFLLQRSLAGQKAKETEIAIDVFGKKADFDMTQDASVRVHIHKLRRKLEEYYAGPGRNEEVRLLIPKGEYRLTVDLAPAQDMHLESIPAPTAILSKRKLQWLAVVIAVSLLVNAALLFREYAASSRNDGYAELRNYPVWQRMLGDDLPIYIVVGNYYIFGETGADMEVRRLIREFDINSAMELEEYLNRHPERADQYTNLDLSYLPISCAYALRDVMPILASRKKTIQVVLSSEINARMLKSAHIIYIGYLSGMGAMRDLIFSRSRFTVGETYDELIDRKSKHSYLSQGGEAVKGETPYHDYGYVLSLSGPGGNQLLVIAGTRDVAVMQMAEVLTGTKGLNELSRTTPTLSGFEALYEVSGIDRTNVSGKLISTSAYPANVATVPTKQTSSP